MSNTPTIQSEQQVIPQRKPRRSTKPASVKAAVIAKRTHGQSITQISKDLGITRPTTYAILKESDFDAQMEEGRISCISLIPKGAQAIEKAFDRGDGALAVRMFEGLGILGNENFKRGSLMKADVHLNLAIQNLIQAKPLESTPICTLTDTPKQSEEK